MIESSDPTLISASLRMIWGLLIVLALLLCIYALLKKRLPFAKNSKNSAINVKEIRYLMPKKSLCLVEIGGQEYLLGLGNDSIHFLSAVSSAKKGDFKDTLSTLTQECDDEQ